MKTYLVTIKPISGFGTPIKGDTLFGQICWQIYYDENLFGKKLSDLLSDYNQNPFIVISSAYPKINNKIALKRPDLPIDMIFSFDNLSKDQIIKQRKQYKSKNWFFVPFDQEIRSIKEDTLYLNDEEIFDYFLQNLDFERKRYFKKLAVKSIILDFEQMHNTINRLTGKTGEGRFAPYAVGQKVYLPGIELAVFIGLREDLKIDMVINALERIGKVGYGKDSSIGLGKYNIKDYSEIDLKKIFEAKNANACYTLSPTVPDDSNYKKIYFSPFIRFGRHGDILAKSSNPFKNPVIMADEGAVYVLQNGLPEKPYIGKAIYGLSKVKQETVHQGYSLFIPLRVEE